MDPNHWSNYNQPYSRINHGSAMPSAHSSINRYELPLLDQGIGTDRSILRPSFAAQQGHAVSCLNRYDLPLLDQGLGTGLGALSPSLSPHTSLPSARGLGGIPQVNYGHPLHSSVSQFLDTMNLQSSFPSQSHYKTVPSSFPFDSAPRSSAEQPTCYSSGRYATSSHSGVPAHSKSIFSQEFHSSKDLASSLTPSPMSPNPHVSEASNKGWSLSNFVPTSSNPFANLTNELSGPGNYAPASPSPQQHIPPPAHSTNRAISSLSQRSPYQPDPIYCSTSLSSSKSVPSPQLPPVYSRTSQSAKPAHSPQLPSPYNMSNINHEQQQQSQQQQQQPATPLSQPPTPRPSNYSSPQDLESISGSQSPLYDPYSCISTKNYSVTSSAPTYSSVSHMTSDMGYDPVSPTQPLSEPPPQSQHQQQGDSFCTVSLQDLASIGSSQDRMQNMKNRESVLLQETSHIMLHSTNSKVPQSLNDLQQTVQNIQSITSRPQAIQSAHNMHNGQLSQSVQSPLQQSPISVGSPQAPMSLGSPQTPLPSSTVVQAPPPVQAVADSTTKPKRGRGRKKKDILYDKALELGQEHLFNDEPINMTQNTASVFPNMAQVMSQQCHDTLPPQPLTEDTMSPTYQDHMDDRHLKIQNVSPQMDPSGRLNDRHQESSPPNMQQYSVPGSIESSQPSSDPVTNMHANSVAGSIGSPQGVLSEDMPNTGTPMSDHNERPAPIPDQFSDSLTPPTPTQELSEIQNYGMRRMTDSAYASSMAHNQMVHNQMNLQHPEQLCPETMHMKQEPSLQMHPSSYMNYSQVPTSKDLVHGSNSFEDLAMSKDDGSEFDDLVNVNTAETKPQMLSNDDETLGVAVATIHADFSTMSDKKFKRSRTKAEQKQMPLTVTAITLQAEYDEEFQHLQNKAMLDGELLKRPATKSSKTVDAFQESYINFLHGKKTETLSSLSYANITRRTPLTKYDPRLFTPSQNSMARADTSASAVKKTPSLSEQESPKVDAGSANQASTAFSDEENSMNVVEDLFQNLCDNFEPDNQVHKQLVPEAGRSPRRGRGSRGGRTPRGKRGRARYRTFSGEREDMGFFDKVPSENEGEKTLVPVPVRQSSSRKAKEKMLLQRKRKHELGGSDSGSDTDHIPGMFLGLKSDSADSAENYDSDKDPAWTPFALEKRQAAFNEGEFPEIKRRVRSRGRARSRVGSRRPRGRGRKNSQFEMMEPLPGDGEKIEDKGISADEELGEVGGVDDDDDEENGVHNFEEGEFIIEKKDLNNYDKYPVWKIETGRLQKYELINEEDKIYHRAVPTYRTWTTAWRKQFSPIKTKLFSKGFNTEIIEVESEFCPKSPSEECKMSRGSARSPSKLHSELVASPLMAKAKSDSESEGEEEMEEEEEEEDDDKRHSDSSAADSESESEMEEDEAPVHNFEPGKFIIETKDLSNYESYPIWKIENGKMLHKYELVIEDGKIRHRAVPTYSSWMPTLRQQFKPIIAKLISQGFNKEIVEVEEFFRPKPPSDGSLERQYEDDPLVESFNIYMQIFLTQALEPGFLNAITTNRDNFYLKPLQNVDRLIDLKVDEIESKVQWKSKFKETLKMKPVLRELDRPNLKQACQACENASQPAIKSIHLYGQPYDLFNLGDQSVDHGESSAVAQEFMIGKTAAMYVGSYHSLYHFKYHIYERCLAKVNIIKESGNPFENSEIIDHCLQNRAWILKLFEDLKTLLEKR